MGTIVGSMDQWVRHEIEFLKRTKHYREIGDTTTMSDWFEVDGSNVDTCSVNYWFRKRANGDGTYEFLCFSKADEEGKSFYAKTFTMNYHEIENNDSDERYHAALVESGCLGCPPECSLRLGEDHGGQIIRGLISSSGGYWMLDGYDIHGNLIPAGEYLAAACSKEELLAYCEERGLDIYKIFPRFTKSTGSIYETGDFEVDPEWFR